MIQDDEQLAIVRKQMHLVESALRSLKCEVLPKSEERYRLWAESTVDQIMKLRREIDEYIGIDDQLRRRVESDGYDEAFGIVRQIDLDARTFVLRNRGGDLPDLMCEYDRFLDQQVKTHLDEKVVVLGRFRISDKTHRQTMEVDAFDSKAVDQPAPQPIRPKGPASLPPAQSA